MKLGRTKNYQKIATLIKHALLDSLEQQNLAQIDEEVKFCA